jgi:hypothetical protein
VGEYFDEEFGDSKRTDYRHIAFSLKVPCSKFKVSGAIPLHMPNFEPGTLNLEL